MPGIAETGMATAIAADSASAATRDCDPPAPAPRLSSHMPTTSDGKPNTTSQPMSQTIGFGTSMRMRWMPMIQWKITTSANCQTPKPSSAAAAIRRSEGRAVLRRHNSQSPNAAMM